MFTVESNGDWVDYLKFHGSRDVLENSGTYCIPESILNVMYKMG